MPKPIRRSPRKFFSSLIFSSAALTLFAPLASANVIPDPSFERGTAKWKLQDNTTTFVSSSTRTGSKALKMVNVGNGSNSPARNVSQTAISGIVAGQEYEYTVWVRGNNVQGVGSGGKPLAVVRWLDGSKNIIRTHDGKLKESYQWAPYGTYGYRPMKLVLQAPSKARYLDVHFRTWWGCTGGNTIWDDVSLVKRDLSARGSLLATHQAEAANTKSGGKVLSKYLDDTGSGYFDVTTSGAILEWKNVSGGGARVLSFRYSWEGNIQNLEVFVNGVSQGKRKPLPTGRRGVWASDLWKVNLPSGNNTVRLKISKKGAYKSQPMIDKMEVYSSSGGGGGGGGTTNNPPVLKSIGGKTITEGQLLNVSLSASDGDGPAPLKLSQTNNLPGKPNILTDHGDGVGELYWNSKAGDAAGSPYSVTVTATDGKGATDKETIKVTVLPAGGATYKQVFSTSADRSNAKALSGATVKGRIYAFVTPATDIQKVDFFVDGTLRQTERAAPYDLAGTGSNNLAKAFDTTTLSDGSHTIRARITRASGGTENISANVTVANSGGGSFKQLFSTQADRSNPKALSGATVKGRIYVFVTPETDISRVDFFVDGTLRQTERIAPYDLGGTADSGAAKAFNTTTLSNGSHTIRARIVRPSGNTNIYSKIVVSN